MNKSMKKGKKNKILKSAEKEGEAMSPKRRKTVQKKGGKKGKQEVQEEIDDDPMDNLD